MRASGIGGQAVMEGVMMKNGDDYAVAVRKSNGEIEIKKDVYPGFTKKHPLFRVPFIRGVFSFVDSMYLGMKTLTFSASFFEEEEEPDKLELWLRKKFGEKTESVIMGVTVCLAILLAVGIFMILPVFLANLVTSFVKSEIFQALLEGALRIVIFIGYVLLISQMKDIQRVFMYHGAEHKCINCIEHGLPLTVENVRKSSRLHKRCGTSFLLIVMVISVLVFTIFHTNVLWLRLVSRLILIPAVAGISYEFLKLAGRSENALVNFLSKPGMALQKLTTREPDDSMIEVGMASVSAVFDWEAFLKENEEQA